MFDRPNLWQQTPARRSLLGSERTHNPTPAAAALLKGTHGKRAYQRAVKLLGTKRRRAHAWNPAPVLVAGLLAKAGAVQKLAQLGAKLGIKQDTTPGRVAEAAQSRAIILSPDTNTSQKQAALGLVIYRHDTNNFTDDRHGYAPILRELEAAGVLSGSRGARQVNMFKLQQVGRVSAAAAGTPGPSFVESVLGSPVGGKVAQQLVREATKRPRRQRYPTYTDRYGRQRYSTKPPGQQMRLPAGASPIPGSPYSFFRGAVGAGGAAATVGQVALAGAAGVAAYYVTNKLLQYLGGRAQKAEEAGVNAALAFREARAEFQRDHGRAPNRTEVREMGDAMKAQLVELGYDPVTYQRKRGKVTEFLETYNPFGG